MLSAYKVQPMNTWPAWIQWRQEDGKEVSV